MATIFSRMLHPFRGTVTHGVVHLYGKVTTTTSGTIDTTSCDGFAVTKTATKTGRYTVQLGSAAAPNTVAELLMVNVRIKGADDTAYTDAKGISVIIRDDDVATDGTFEIQFLRNTTNADTEIVDAMSFFIEIVVKNSTVSP
jgi:hypothetical protein